MNHDTLIDAVAREMTASQPSADFRARVLGRVEARPSRRWTPALVRVAAAAAGLAALALVLRPTPDVPLPPGSLIPSSSASAVLPVPAAAPAPHSTVDGSAAPRVGAGVRVIFADELAWHERAVQSMPGTPAITIEPIQPERPSIAPITVEPLASEPIALPPLEARLGERR